MLSWLFVVFEVAQDLFGFLSGSPGPTAVSVHLAGAAFGFLYYKGNWRLASWFARSTGPLKLIVVSLLSTGKMVPLGSIDG